MDVPVLEIRNLAKRFPARQGREAPSWVIQDLSFSVRASEFLTIIGPSGAGKSTLLNMIAQVDVASSGEILFKNGLAWEAGANPIKVSVQSASTSRTNSVKRAQASGPALISPPPP